MAGQGSVIVYEFVADDSKICKEGDRMESETNCDLAELSSHFCFLITTWLLIN